VDKAMMEKKRGTLEDKLLLVNGRYYTRERFIQICKLERKEVKINNK
jgi:hypothetical protein